MQFARFSYPFLAAVLVCVALPLSVRADSDRDGSIRHTQNKKHQTSKHDSRGHQYQADKSYRNDRLQRYDSYTRADRSRHPDQYRLDQRFRHNHYYPRRGYELTRLPPGYSRIRSRNNDYYFRGGVWYHPVGARFVVVAPPFGLVVPVLPAFYSTLWFGGIPYYYANDVYYTWQPVRNGYVVTQPPANIEHEPVSAVSDELFIYPSRGQSKQLQADDRYECHSWSVGQTQYDPSQPPANLSTDDAAARRDNYMRAMRACLEGRGYSVS